MDGEADSEDSEASLAGGYSCGDLAYFIDNSQWGEVIDRTRARPWICYGEEVVISCGHSDGEKLFVRFGGRSTPGVLVYEDQLARNLPPPIPGNFVVDEKVYYTDASCKLDNGKTHTYGQEYIVMGKVPDKARVWIGTRETGSVSNVKASQISRSAPPPLLGGFEVSETVYYLGLVCKSVPPCSSMNDPPPPPHPESEIALRACRRTIIPTGPTSSSTGARARWSVATQAPAFSFAFSWETS